MNDKLNIDKSIKEKLDGFSVAPPSHVWNNIQGQMALQQRKKRVAYISWIAAAAVVVFAFIAGWVFNERTDGILPETAEQQIVQPPQGESETTDKTTEIELANEASFVAETNTNTTNVNDKSKKVVSNVTVSTEITNNNLLVATAEKISYDLLESIEAIFTIEQTNVFVAEQTHTNVEWGITTNDEILIAENIRNTKKQEKSDNTWKIGANVSPGYASNSTTHSEQYAENMNYSDDGGSSNVGAGFSVQYKTSKRLRIESGVYYSQNGQSSNSANSELFGYNNRADYMMAASEDLAGAPGFSNTVQLSSNGIAMNSSAGVINMSSAPKGATVATSAESVNAKNANTLTTSGEFSQVFQFVEIPLYLRYSVLDKRFGIEIMGGLNAGLVVGNNAYIDNEYGKQNIGSTDDISTMNLSGTVGVGMNYALGKHFSLALEPRINYFLNSINSNPDVDFRPYRVGVFTGVYYEF